jgi:xeroderma pigmentosum group C-complementing protein
MNKYGNIEIWDGLKQFVPKGAVYIEGINAPKVAKSLGIPFVPAVVDFERKAEYTFPKIGGVVTLVAHEMLLKDALSQFTQFQDDQFHEKNQKRIYDKWKKLIRMVLSRQQLREEFGS